MASLAGRDSVLAIEGKWRLLCETRTLPLVVHSECTQKLVIIQLAWDGGLVAGRAELSRFQQRAHDGLLMLFEVTENLRIGDTSGHRRTLLIDHHRWGRHHVAAGSGGVGRLDRVAHLARDALIFKR